MRTLLATIFLVILGLVVGCRQEAHNSYSLIMSAKNGWGPPCDNLHCRLELQKEIFAVGEPITLGFRAEPLSQLKNDTEYLLPYEKIGLVKNLKVIGPGGKRLSLKEQDIYNPSGRFYTSFIASGYYDFEKQGEYFITAENPLDDEKYSSLASQTISLLVMPPDFITVTLQTNSNWFKYKESVPVTLNIVTNANEQIEINDVSIRFETGEPRTLWSSPKDNPNFPSKLLLTKLPVLYTFDVSTTGWDYRFSSVGPCRDLYQFIKKGDRILLVTTISGNYKQKRLEIESKDITLEFR